MGIGRKNFDNRVPSIEPLQRTSSRVVSIDSKHHERRSRLSGGRSANRRDVGTIGLKPIAPVGDKREKTRLRTRARYQLRCDGLYHQSHSGHCVRALGRFAREHARDFGRSTPRVRLCRWCHRRTAAPGCRRPVYGDWSSHARSRRSDSGGRNPAGISCAIRRPRRRRADEPARHFYRDWGRDGLVPAPTWELWSIGTVPVVRPVAHRETLDGQDGKPFIG
jgi:hypothetical protein